MNDEAQLYEARYGKMQTVIGCDQMQGVWMHRDALDLFN